MVFKRFSCFPIKVSALPRTLILLLLFLTAFVWISAILMLIMAARLKWIYWDVAQSFSLRLAITVFTIILVYSVGQMNVVSEKEDFNCFSILRLTFFAVHLPQRYSLLVKFYDKSAGTQ